MVRLSRRTFDTLEADVSLDQAALVIDSMREATKDLGAHWLFSRFATLTDVDYSQLEKAYVAMVTPYVCRDGEEIVSVNPRRELADTLLWSLPRQQLVTYRSDEPGAHLIDAGFTYGAFGLPIKNDSRYNVIHLSAIPRQENILRFGAAVSLPPEGFLGRYINGLEKSMLDERIRKIAIDVLEDI